MFFNPIFQPPAPTTRKDAGQCALIPLNAVPGTVVHPQHGDLRFTPTFADIVRTVANTLSQQGTTLSINDGFRTAADQAQRRDGGSGDNPAARYSDHQLGNAVDINGTKTASFHKIVQAFKAAGASWGGDYRHRKDPPHFYIRPQRANAINTAECERENPR